MKVSTTRDITEKLCVYDLAISFNKRPVSHAATVMLPIDDLVCGIMFSSGSTLRSRSVIESTNLPVYQFLMIIAQAYT